MGALRHESTTLVGSLSIALAVGACRETQPLSQHGSAQELRRIRTAQPSLLAPPASSSRVNLLGTEIDIGLEPATSDFLETVAFRTALDGWVADEDGGVFRTLDGGLTFAPVPRSKLTLRDYDRAKAVPTMTTVHMRFLSSEPRVWHLRWLSETRGVAFAVSDAQSIALVTSDAGETWRRTYTGRWGPVDAFAVYGTIVWACGTACIVSRDGGESYVRLGDSPFSADGPCRSLSFASETLGWAASRYGLWATADGGQSFRRLAWSQQREHAWDEPWYLNVLRIDGKSGFVQLGLDSGNLIFRTRDGGESWEVAGQWAMNGRDPRRMEGLFATVLPGTGQHVYAPREVHSVDEAMDIVPAFGAQVSAWGAGVVRLKDRELSYFERGQLVRASVARIRRSDERETLRGDDPLGPYRRRGWTDHALVESADGGSSWVTVHRTDRRIIRVATVRRETNGSDSALIELEGGDLLRAARTMTGWGRMTRSEQPDADRALVQQREVMEAGGPSADTPLSCLRDSQRGWFTIRRDSRGCFHATSDEMRVEWNGVSAAVRSGATSRPLSLAQRRAAVLRLLGAAQAADDIDCGSTTSIDIEVSWQCGDGPTGSMRAAGASCGGDPRFAKETRLHALELLARDLTGASEDAP